MSKMKSVHKPPLARSPMRLRPRRALQSNPTSMQTPPGSLTKSQVPNRTSDNKESDLRPEYRTISCELQALAKMVRDELGDGDKGNNDDGFPNTVGVNSISLFERGRFYEEYSARRNERLKRKKGEKENERKTVYSLGVNVESTKRRDSKKLESARKSTSAIYSGDRSEHPRYLLRSSKEKKPPLYVSSERSVVGGDRRTGARRVRNI